MNPTTDPTIDKSFDQTGQHVHAPGIICPTCKIEAAAPTKPRKHIPVGLKPLPICDDPDCVCRSLGTDK